MLCYPVIIGILLCAPKIFSSGAPGAVKQAAFRSVTVFWIPQASGQKRMGLEAVSAMVGLSGFFPGDYFEFPLL